MHDHAGIAAQFQDNFLLPAIFLDLPAHGRAAGKADQLNALVRHQQAGVFVRERQHVQAAVRPARLLHGLRQQQGGQRSLGRGLQHQGTAGGNGGRNLVGHQVQRKIKGSDSGNRPQREAAHNAPAPGGKFLPVERQVFAVNPRALLGGDIEGEDGAFHLGARGLDRLARFLRHGAGKFLLALGDVLRHPPQHALAFKSRQPAGGAESFYGGCDGGFGVFPPSLEDSGDHGAVKRSPYLDRVAFLNPLAIDKKSLRAHRSRGHLCHGVSLTSTGSGRVIIGLPQNRQLSC